MGTASFSVFIFWKKTKAKVVGRFIPGFWDLPFFFFLSTIESEIHGFLLCGLHFPCESFEPIRACLDSQLTEIMILCFSNAKLGN